MKDGAIVILVARSNIIIKTLNSLYNNWNKKFKYPVYIHTFGKILNSNLKTKILKEIDSTIKFVELNPSIPEHLVEEQLFYNRKDIDYVKKSFSKKRLGYLYMCNFFFNITSFGKNGCLGDELKEFNKILFIDDDVHFKKDVDIDLFKLADKNLIVGADEIKNNNKKEFTETNLNLWSFFRNYIIKNNIIPLEDELNKSIKNDNQDYLFNSNYHSGCFVIFNIKKINTLNWRNFLQEVNNSGGIYKFRWNPTILIELYVKTFFKDGILNLGYLKDDIIENKVEGSDAHIHFGYPDFYNSLIMRTILNFVGFIKLSIKKILKLFNY